MKTFTHLTNVLFCVIPLLFLSGCSSDQEWTTEATTYSRYKITVDSLPQSIGQTYDGLYQEYRMIYTDSAVSPDLIIQRVEAVAQRILVLEAYRSIDTTAVQDILSPATTLRHYASDVLSEDAQSMFFTFFESLAEADHAQVYETALDFEQRVRRSAILTTQDKSILLILTAIMQYHTENENNDDDWSDGGSNILKAMLYGSRENSSRAVVLAVVVRLIQNGY